MNVLQQKPQQSILLRGQTPPTLRQDLRRCIGQQAMWVQGGDGSPGSDGYEFVGEIVAVIMIGDSAHKQIRRRFRRPAKRHTTDVSDRWHRFLIRLDDSDDYATPIIEKVLIGPRGVKVHY